MLRLAADENLSNDIVRVQDAELSGAEDPEILEWAVREGWMLFTHDVSTMTRFAYERIHNGKPMAGVFEIGVGVPVGSAMEDVCCWRS